MAAAMWRRPSAACASSLAAAGPGARRTTARPRVGSVPARPDSIVSPRGISRGADQWLHAEDLARGAQMRAVDHPAVEPQRAGARIVLERGNHLRCPFPLG